MMSGVKVKGGVCAQQVLAVLPGSCLFTVCQVLSCSHYHNSRTDTRRRNASRISYSNIRQLSVMHWQSILDEWEE